MKMKKILVSACLLGKNTKYNGGNNENKFVISLSKDYEIIPICPEVDGGLPCPRNPSEIVNNKVISSSNLDVTEQFLIGANIALKKAQDHNPEFIVLKENSPSCGIHYIYDGSFKGIKIQGKGITASLLSKHNYKLYSEKEIEENKHNENK